VGELFGGVGAETIQVDGEFHLVVDGAGGGIGGIGGIGRGIVAVCSMLKRF
jgi:hypothetical protein